MTGGVDRIERVRGGEDWHLQDERELLQRSLEDAAREHGAGDLTTEDYELLRARDERRLAEVDAALAARAVQEAVPDAGRARGGRRHRAAAADAAGGADNADGDDRDRADRAERAGRVGLAGHTTASRRGKHIRDGRMRGKWRRRWWIAGIGVASVVAATVLLVVELTSPRLPGEDATGSISLNTAQTIEQQLAQAKTLVAAGKATRALQLYGDVLAEDPRQPVALAEWGWLDWRAASTAKESTVAAEGASALEEAVKLDPELFAAQYYLGVILYEEGATTKALSHFGKFLTDKPTAKWLREAAPDLRAAYAAANEPLPAAVPAG